MMTWITFSTVLSADFFLFMFSVTLKSSDTVLFPALCPVGISHHLTRVSVCVLQGLRFLHFPYLLTLQLKRFDFDYTTMHRIKLNDRMTFPEELDMSPFIDVEDEVRGSLKS